MAALFIISLVIGFAYLHLKVNGTLDQWQLTTCILASGLASILVFIPHLIDRFLAIAFDPSNRKDEELHRKTYFDIKEMKSQLDAFSVKIDKVPTLVDKIISDSQNQEDSPDSSNSKIINELEEFKNSILQRVKGLEDLIVQTPLLAEPDPGLNQVAKSIPLIQSSVDYLSNEVKEMQKLVINLSNITSGSLTNKKIISSSSTNLSVDDNVISEDPDLLSEESENIPSVETTISNVLEETDEGIDSRAEKNADEIQESNEKFETDHNGNVKKELEPSTDPELLIEPSTLDQDQEIDNEEEDFKHTVKTPPEEEANENSSIEKEKNLEESLEEPTVQEMANEKELVLDLPDPAETLRKVDAILQETNPDEPLVTSNPPPIKELISSQKSSTGTTSVVANVMIGIGNKPYLRGDGPGLNWNQGVPMNFIEIGKWAWSPTRKNASLTVQLYRNDKDPDQSGKIDVKPGEKVEITPTFE